MLLLLRRALAQLRGDPPESRPNALRAEQPAPGAPYGPEWYGSVYPIPTLNLPRLLPGLSATRPKHGCAKYSRNCKMPTLEPHGDPSVHAVLPGSGGQMTKALRSCWRSSRRWCGSTCSLAPLPNTQPQGSSSRHANSLLEAFAPAGAPLRGIMPMRPTELPGNTERASTLDAIAGKGGALFAPRAWMAGVSVQRAARAEHDPRPCPQQPRRTAHTAALTGQTRHRHCPAAPRQHGAAAGIDDSSPHATADRRSNGYRHSERRDGGGAQSSCAC